MNKASNSTGKTGGLAQSFVLFHKMVHFASEGRPWGTLGEAS